MTGVGLFRVSANPALTATEVAATSANLNLFNHAGDWYYKHTTPAGGTCSTSAVSGTTADVTELTAGTTYTFKAYSDSACATEIAGASAFTTLGVSVNNLAETASDTPALKVGGVSGNNNRVKRAFAFTAGADTTNLQSVTLKFGTAVGSPGNISLKIHADDSGNPASAAIANLTPSRTADNTPSDQYAAYTCAGAGCILSASTKYHLVAEAPNSAAGSDNYYLLTGTASNNETTTPTSATGWDDIANDSKESTDGGTNWSNVTDVGLFRVSAVSAPALTATEVAATSAKLNLANYAGDWYYKGAASAGGTCSESAVSGKSADVSLN